MSGKTVKAALHGTFTWGGVRYGPGSVSVPVELAAWLGAKTEVEPAKAPAKADALPDDFPERDLLTGTPWTTVSALRAVSDDDLLSVDGIGPAKLKAIRAALKG